ncbi:probable histone-lysine N-methyltransferase CG1716 [Toxorhynchites rutilus septentrionalis]|uniref:probable histone-lysine N-methyltransferase CG1716 n=1 Tax=Toxorhynchites rutilus septentrionalis TaxID=329112 RepID=UPI00247A324F|nr:probable histone-lysine N-methyltransferase CG1716 [Toxorhynchites rutilus septentrionalis]
MVRTTRAAMRNSSLSPKEEVNELDQSPPDDTTAIEGATAASGSGAVTEMAEHLYDGNPISSNMSPSVVLEKLSIEQVAPGSASATKRGGRAKGVSSTSRAMRSKRKKSPSIADRDESSDDGLVELIEIVDEDSKSRESSDSTPDTVVTQDSTKTDIQTSKKEQSLPQPMDYDVSVKAFVIGESSIKVLQQANLDKKQEEDDASSSVSSGPHTVHEGEGGKSPKSEIVGTRKSKRQVKVTNKFRDFVVDAPLPSSQVPYSDVKLARSACSAKKNPPKELEVFLSSDELSPDSPPMLIRPPVRTYSSKKEKVVGTSKTVVEEKPKRRITRSTTPVNREPRGRKKKDTKTDDFYGFLDVGDETILLPTPEDRNDSTLMLDIDSSYFTDDEFIKYGSPSPTDFCGWPEEEFADPVAGPSRPIVVEKQTAYSSVQSTTEINTELGDKNDLPTVKRRGRVPKAAQLKPVVPPVESNVRPAGSTFIKRSYKTTRSSVANVVSDVNVKDDVPVSTKSKEAAANKSETIESDQAACSEKLSIAVPAIVDLNAQEEMISEQSSDVKPMETVEIEDVLEDAIEIVLQADEIINDDGISMEVTSAASIVSYEDVPRPPRNRRRIRGGSRLSPADATPRRGRSKKRGPMVGEAKDDSKSAEVDAPEVTEVKVEPMVVDAEPSNTETIHQVVETLSGSTEPLVLEDVEMKQTDKQSSNSILGPDVFVKDEKDDTSRNDRKVEHKSRKHGTKSVSLPEEPKAKPEVAKQLPDLASKTAESEEAILLDTKDIIPSQMVKEEQSKEDEKTEALVEPKAAPVVDTLSKSPKKSSKTSKESKNYPEDATLKDTRKSKESKDSSSKDARKGDSSRKERDSSKSSKDRDRDKERRSKSETDKKEYRSEGASDSGKKRTDRESKTDSDKKRAETTDKNLLPDPEKKDTKSSVEKSKKSSDADLLTEKKVSEKKLADAEKKESKPPTPVPKQTTDKPKKNFDTELQALEPSIKQKASDDAKRSKDSEKSSRKSDKHAHRSESADKRKSGSSSSSSSDPKRKSQAGKSRSTDSSPITAKHSSSSSKSKSSKESSSSSKKDYTKSSKGRKSIAGCPPKDEKIKDESLPRKERDSKKEKPKEIIEPSVDVQPPKAEPAEEMPKPVEMQEIPLVKPPVEQEPQPEMPRIATKASRKMYQNEEEIEIASSSQESISSESKVSCEPIMQEPTTEEEIQQISEVFDNTVQISGPRPEVALKEFQNISLSDEKPAEMEQKPAIDSQEEIAAPTRETVPSSPTQDPTNDDSNSNNSSTTDSVKDSKASEREDDANIRRSSRIKTISSQKQRTSGHGLVKDRDKFLKKTTISVGFDSKVLKDAVTGNFNVVSAADNSGELPAGGEFDALVTNIELSEEYLRDMEDKLSRFETIRENVYHCDKVVSREAKKMTCDCFLTGEEIERGELGCGEDCLNKLLMIECGSRCVVAERCTNKRFQKLEYANCQVFRTEKKGFGIQASTDIAPGEFIMEYVGEVLNSEQFDERAELYSKEKNKHYYFMALRSDAIIDATTKGNISRFINHSCEPNAETQKWTVNGELRIGFFSTKYIMPGDEITFDYQFQRYGRRAQKCYCEAESCTGWIGGDPGSDGESEYEDDEEIEESEEEEEIPPEVVPPVAPPVVEPVEKIVDSEKREETADLITPIVESVPPETAEPTEPTVETKPPEPKPKKVRKRVERQKKRRPQIHEDPDLEQEINNLLKTGLKNQAQTLKLSRLMVRAKDIKSRSRLLIILQSGELPCRRLFLDYHGLRLLYGWICESTESIEDLKFRIQILDTLDRLPIPNKTMLKDSKILQTMEKWAKIEKTKEKEKEVEKEKEKDTSSTSSPSDSNGAGSDSSSEAKKQDVVGNAEVLKNMPELLKLADLGRLKEIISSTCVEKEAEKEKPPAASTITDAITSAASLIDSIQIPEPEDENAPEEKRLVTQIRILSCKLLISWVNLKEVFRIPKKERIEQMKEHEREADLRYKALGLGDDDQTSQRHSSSRYTERSRELKRRKSVDDRDLLGYHKMKRPLSTVSPMMKMDNMSKQQRRQLFEMKVAHEEAERRNKELWMQHENNCMKFGLNPHITSPMDVPAKMNPATGEYFSADDRLLPTPPSHVYFKVLPPPMPTNPEDYELPPMDLPSLWKFAIDDRGRLYYYHVKDRIPQWEPPKKDNPYAPGRGLRDEDISMSSDASTTDTEDSEEEHLNVQLEQLRKKKKKQQSSFNLDDVLAKPDDMNDDLSKTIKDLEAGDSSPHGSNSAEKLFGDNLEKTAEELLQHRKRKHSNKLVQERVISPRTEEDKLYGQMEMKRYKETKEKLRRRKEEAKRLRARSMLDKSLSDSPFSGSYSGDNLDKSATESSLIDDDLVVSHKIVEDKCIVDELDILTKKKKISPYEEWQKVKQRLGKKRAAKTAESSSLGGSSSSAASSSLGTGSSKVAKRKRSDKSDLNSDEARKIKEKFRGEIAGVIVQHLSAYRKESCQNGRITNTEDFKHLARKLTHFVLLKELKHCDNTVHELEVTDSVRTKAREFIKKYMAKHGTVYVRGENEPDYANINL